MEKLDNPTVESLTKKIQEAYVSVEDKIIVERHDIESVSFMRGSMFAYKKILRLLGKEITLVLQGEVKENA